MKHLINIILLSIASFSFHANALQESENHLGIKFGGWSHHGDSMTKDLINKYTDKDFEYNESHNGIGIDYFSNFVGSNHYFGAGFWYMTDSYRQHAYHLGLAYKYKYNIGYEYLDSIDFNMTVTYFNRSGISSQTIIGGNSSELNIDNPELLESQKIYSIERIHFVLPSPYITINFTKNFNIDIMGLADKSSSKELINGENVYRSEWETVIFIRAGYNF